MDRLYRPTLLALVAAAAALLAREVTLRQHGRPEPARANATGEPAAPYPPRLLEFPEGVVPVALNFTPPPPAPLDSMERQLVVSGPLNSPAPNPPRFPAVKSTPFAPPPLPEVPALPAAREEFHSAPSAIPPANDSWMPPREEASSEQPAFGPELTPAQTDDFPAQRSIIKRVAPIDSPVLPAITPLAAPVNQPAPAKADELQAVDSRARRMVDHAFSVAQRGATYTARSELLQALRLIAQSLDAAGGTQAHVESLAAAIRALEEGESFQSRSSRPDATPNVKNLVGGHRTPVLKDADLSRLTALEAMQQYYTYAQEQFAAAAGRRPSASLALYGLGKLHMAMAEKPSDAASMDLPKAMVYHQAAMLVDPQNHLASNELGVLLARYEQWQEAKRVFLHSVAVNPLPQTWHNLAVVHERLGETPLAAQARFELEQLARRNPQAVLSSGGPSVRWLSPTEFAGTAERPMPPSVPAPQPLQTSQEPPPGGVEVLKPWTWF